LIWNLLLVYLTGVVLFFVVFNDEFDRGEAWIVLLWPILIAGTVVVKLRRAMR